MSREIIEKKRFEKAKELRDYLNTLGESTLDRTYLNSEDSDEYGMSIEFVEEKLSSGMYRSIEFK